MKCGIIIRNVIDLRAEPKFRSERRSQLLFNELVHIGKIRDGYGHIYQSDGYHGWVDIRGVEFLAQNRTRFNPDHRFNTAVCRLYPLDEKYSYPSFLFYGTEMQLAELNDRYAIMKDRRGFAYRVPKGRISQIKNVALPRIEGKWLIKEAARFIGTPYLWGGITPFGFDCSGLVQMVCRSAGINLPRDSSRQKKIGRKIGLEDVKAGDLFFFKGHVAIALDRYRMIHSSLGSGGVAFNSLNPDDHDYRRDLADIFLEARRVLP